MQKPCTPSRSVAFSIHILTPPPVVLGPDYTRLELRLLVGLGPLAPGIYRYITYIPGSILNNRRRAWPVYTAGGEQIHNVLASFRVKCGT